MFNLSFNNYTFLVEDEDVSITGEINSSGVLLINGDSGVGKTTLIKSLITNNGVDKKSLMRNGQNFFSTPIAKRELGIMFQHTSLFPDLSVYENVFLPLKYSLKFSTLSKGQKSHKVKSILQSLKMDSYYDRMPSELSGGQQRKIAFAQAIVSSPKIILMDEPYKELDDNSVNLINASIWNYLNDNDCIFIICSHLLKNNIFINTKMLTLVRGKNIF